MSTTQYQPLTAPFVASEAAPETITCDKWGPRHETPIRRRTLTAAHMVAQPMFGVVIDVPVQGWTGHCADRVPGRRRTTWFQPSSAAPLHVPDVTDPLPALAWRGSAPDRTPRAPRAVEFQPFTAPTYVPDVTHAVTALSWRPAYPDRNRSAARVIEFPPPAAPLFVPDVTQPVTSLSWRPEYPDRYRASVFHAALQRAWQSDRFTAPAEVIAPNLAAPVYPSRVDARRPLTPHPAWAAPLYVADVTVTAPASSWRGTWPDAVRRPTLPSSAHQALGWAVNTPITVVVPDHAQPVFPERVPRRAAVVEQFAHAVPLYVADVTVTAPLLPGWLPVVPDWIARRKFATSLQYAATTTEQPIAEVVLVASRSLTGTYGISQSLVGTYSVSLPLTGTFES